jgi:hypothetical protein
MSRNGEPPGRGVPKHDVAGPLLIVIDTHAAGDNLQILNPPIARIPLHFRDELRRVRHQFDGITGGTTERRFNYGRASTTGSQTIGVPVT